MGAKIDLTDKDAILVSLYEDITFMDLENLNSFRSKTTRILLTLEKEFQISVSARVIKFDEEVVETTSPSDVKGAAHADITNLRFLLQDQAKDTAIAQLAKLKAHAIRCIHRSPTPKKTIFKVKRAATPVSPSPLSRPENELQRSPTPTIQLKARGGNGLNFSSGLTSFKRKLETEKMSPQLQDSASVSSSITALSVEKQSSFSAPTTPKGRLKKFQQHNSSRSTSSGTGRFKKHKSHGLSDYVARDKSRKLLQSHFPSTNITGVSTGINGKLQSERNILPLKKNRSGFTSYSYGGPMMELD